MPSRSSRRAVAALMFGDIAGCTQPASISIGARMISPYCGDRLFPGQHLGLQRGRQ
jgi:hypothetical protein